MRDCIVFDRAVNPALVKLVNPQVGERNLFHLLFPDIHAYPLICNIVEVTPDKLVFQMQEFHPLIPYSIMSAGATIGVVINRQKSLETLPALVADRCWQAEDIAALKAKQRPIDVNRSTSHTPDLRISASEYAFLSLGYRARQMEDKWNILPAGETIHLLRSWTGEEMYRLEFSPTADGDYALRQMLISETWSDAMYRQKPITDEYEYAIKPGLDVIKYRLKWYQETVLS